MQVDCGSWTRRLVGNILVILFTISWSSPSRLLLSPDVTFIIIILRSGRNTQSAWKFSCWWPPHPTSAFQTNEPDRPEPVAAKEQALAKVAADTGWACFQFGFDANRSCWLLPRPSRAWCSVFFIFSPACCAPDQYRPGVDLPARLSWCACLLFGTDVKPSYSLLSGW